MLTLSLLLALAILSALGAVASIWAAIRHSNGLMGLLAALLIFFALCSSFKAIDVAAQIDHIKLEK